MAVAALLAGCGGGGGGGGAERPTPFGMTISVGNANLLSNEGEIVYDTGTQYASSITVTLTRSDGVAVPPTVVELAVGDSGLGLLSTTTDLQTQTPTLSLTTSAGVVNAVFHTRDQTGSVSVTASAFDATANTTVTRSTRFNIDQGEEVDRITIESTRDSIPANRFGVPIFIGSPYIANLTLRFRNAEGTLVEPDLSEFGVSVSPVFRGAFSTLDDPSTPEVNELFVLLGNGPVESAGGEATILVHSFDQPGPLRVTVTASDPNTQEQFSQEFTLQIVEPASDGLPASVGFTIAEGAQYVQGSGGITARDFDVQVIDGAGVAVPDPTNGQNNVNLQILTESPNSGETLRGRSGSNTVVEGTSIGVATTNGIASASLLSGTEPGIVRIRATVDLTDNNVSNGIGQGLTAESQMIIGDGIPFSVTLTTIPVNTLAVNPVDPNVVIEDPDPLDGIPPQPNSTYSLRVGAIVTDRFGNPPAQAVELQWGLIDSPLDGYPTSGSGVFSLSGFDGDPTEGGTSFFAPTGEFTFAGGGAGPNDTLILFGKDVVGNDDLELARTVDSIIDRFNLLVDEPFNFNDFTGASVDNGPELPYIIGRALVGNVESGSVSDSDGASTTFMNYPASAIGRTTAIYVQGANAGLPGSGALATFADAAIIRYPGLAPLSVIASPDRIPANVTTNVLICVQDAAQVPVVGQFVNFAFTGEVGVASVDGIPSTGLVANPTGFDGCTIASVSTSGVLTGSSDDAMVVFSVGAASDAVEIVIPENALLQAIPSALIGNQSGASVLLRYTDGTGNPVANIALTGSCTSGSGMGAGGIVVIDQQPDPTDANGESTAIISADVDALICEDGTTVAPLSPRDEPAVETCTFTTAGGDPSVEVQIIGVARQIANFSPSATGCPP